MANGLATSDSCWCDVGLQGASFIVGIGVLLVALDFARDRGVLSSHRDSLTGRLVVITGAAGGLGRAMALAFAQQGAVLALWDVRADTLERCVGWLTGECGVPPSSVHAFVVDVSDAAAVASAARAQQAALGPAYVVVSNAAVVNGERVLEASEQRLRTSFAVNILSHVWLARALVPQLASRTCGADGSAPSGGVFVTIGSLMAELPAAGLADYCASKAALWQLHECLRWEMRTRDTGVHCLHVQPFKIDTPLFDGGQAGRFWWVRALLPPLRATTVARRVVTAVGARRDRITVPYVFKWLPVLLELLPAALRDGALYLAGADCAMDAFVGGAARADCLGRATEGHGTGVAARVAVDEEEHELRRRAPRRRAARSRSPARPNVV